MTFSSSFGRAFSPTFHPKSQAKAGGDWWLAGGIDPANCIAAYQPKGAASYAASKVNLANPGTYDATEGTAPGWDATNGWKRTNTEYLKTGITSANGQALIVRFSNCVAADRVYIAGGSLGYGKGIAIMPLIGSNYDRHCWIYGGFFYSTIAAGQGITSGVMALTQKVNDSTKAQGYINGVLDMDNLVINTAGLTGGEYYMLTTSGESQQGAKYLQAAAIYSAPLSAAQVSALTTAMNAL